MAAASCGVGDKRTWRLHLLPPPGEDPSAADTRLPRPAQGEWGKKSYLSRNGFWLATTGIPGDSGFLGWGKITLIF